MKAVLDTGAFIAIEKRDRRVGAMLRVLQQARVPVWTSSAAIAQVWRDGRKQAQLARVLAGVGVRAFAPVEDRRTGELLGRARTEDVVDGHVAMVVEDGDQILTADRRDLEHLLEVRGIDATFVEV
jgi:hypothetical protein